MSKNPPKRVSSTGATRQRSSSPATKKFSLFNSGNGELIFGRQNYIWMGVGVALIFIGLILMMGGQMPSPDVWDENIIYGARITIIAPIFILAGLGVEVYAIFHKKD